MDDEQLILLVQANECLYNKSCPGFKLVDKKRKIWSEIAQQMKLPDEVCMKRWSCLRDRYTKEKRLESLPSGSGAKFKTHWPLMQTMEFISPYIVPRVIRCSFNIVEKIPTELNPSESSPPSSPFLEELASSPNCSMESTSFPINSTCNAENTSSYEVQSGSQNRNKRDISATDSSFIEAVECFKKVCDSQINRKREDDNPLTAFAKMIVALIATMSSKRQLETMQYITAYVMKMKLNVEEASEAE